MPPFDDDAFPPPASARPTYTVRAGRYRGGSGPGSGQGNGAATASFICGIASLILMWVPYAACAAPLLAVAAIILGFAGMGGGKRGGTNGLAVAGLVTGFLHILVLTLLFAFFGYALMRYGKEIRKEVEKERRQQRGRYERE